MKAGGGKAKGSGFEREVCKVLSLWATHGMKEDVFWRSAMSGGRATVMRKRRTAANQAGDISAVGEEGHALTNAFFIECKFYKDLGLTQFLLGKSTGHLARFWRETKEEAEKHGKLPLLIAKQNLSQPFVILDVDVGLDKTFTKGPYPRVAKQPHLYIYPSGVWMYWLSDLFLKPKPKVKHARHLRK